MDESFNSELETIISEASKKSKEFKLDEFIIYNNKIYIIIAKRHIWLVIARHNDFLRTYTETIIATSATKVKNEKLLRLLFSNSRS